MPPIRILLADDHAMMRQALRALLEAEPDLAVVGEAGDGEEALEKALQLQPDVVLMDLSMPAGGGLKATRTVAALTGARVLVFSLQAEAEGMVPALRAGACGYLPKTAAPDDLLRAIRRAARGELVLSPGALPVLVRAAARPDSPTSREGRERCPGC